MKEDVTRFVSSDRSKISIDIIATAMEMFIKNGFSSVRMDDIANKMSISKRTLYELFPSKENLILECAIAFNKYVEDGMAEEVKNEKDIISMTLQHFAFMITISKNMNNSCIYRDLAKFPSVRKYLIARSQLIKDRIRNFLELGIKQGLFRDDINYDLVMQIVSELGKFIIRNDDSKQFSFEELVNSMILVEMRGIATTKGIEIIDKQRTIFNNK